MNILFLMLTYSAESPNMYSDLAEEFRDHGHKVTIMAPATPLLNPGIYSENGFVIVRVKTPKTQGVSNLIKKGIGLALMPHNYKKAYKSHLSKSKFDLIFMPTPPITLIDFVSYLKKKTNAIFYLILRDIHPQSAAGIGLIKYKFMYNYLERRASKGYKIADLIGCMSYGNIDFIAKNYPTIDKNKLVLLMNWQKNTGYSKPKTNIREKFGWKEKLLILFGGNIGLGQRVENIIDLAEHYSHNENIIFLVIGKGVKKETMKQMAEEKKLENIKFIDFMPRDEYLDFVKSVDIGLISINERYKVPTCPSKAVSYMSLKIPIFAMINPGNDYGKIIEKAGAGYWAVGNDKEKIYALFEKMCNDKLLRKKMGENGYNFYLTNLTSEIAYNTIINQIKNAKA